MSYDLTIIDDLAQAREQTASPMRRLDADSWRWVAELTRLNVMLATPWFSDDLKDQYRARVAWLRERVSFSLHGVPAACHALIAGADRYDVGGYE